MFRIIEATALSLVPGLILLAVAACGQRHPNVKAGDQAVAGVTLELKPTANVYELGQVSQGAVAFVATIANETPETIRIAHPAACLSERVNEPGSTANHDRPEILLAVDRPGGGATLLRDGLLHGFDPDGNFVLAIPPGEVRSFSLGWFFQNARGRWANDSEAATVFLAEGPYRLRLSYRNACAVAASHGGPVRVWTGELEAEEVRIEIR